VAELQFPENTSLKVHCVEAYVPKSHATEQYQNNEQVDEAVKIEVALVNQDWKCKHDLFVVRWPKKHWDI